jgi:NTP pyrophosphatase (non-canonical NTP hydrolase)
MEIKELSVEIHKTALEKGFWKNGQNIGEQLMLVVSELSEALEADRKQKWVLQKDKIEVVNGWTNDKDFLKHFEKAIKDKFEDELADATIRIFDLAEQFGIDLTAHIEAKMRYNKTRPFMHGKKY